MEGIITAESFEKLYNLDCSKFIEKKSTGNTELSYLSWAYAWANFKKVYPTAKYEIVKFDGLPYVADPALGIMVYTKVTVGDLTHEMWLPVMDGANKAMKLEPYTYKASVWENKQRKIVEKVVKAADMFDINKTLMRCLVKNLAMFGLGLSIYAGEDIPVPLSDDEEEAIREEVKARATKRAPAQKPVSAPLKAAQPQPAAQLQTITEDMYKAGKCQKIIDKLKSVYDRAAGEIPTDKLAIVWENYNWEDGVFDMVVNDAKYNAINN